MPLIIRRLWVRISHRFALQLYDQGADHQSFLKQWCDLKRVSGHTFTKPRMPGGTRKQHLVDGLRMTSAMDLLRRHRSVKRSFTPQECFDYFYFIWACRSFPWKAGRLATQRKPSTGFHAWPLDGCADVCRGVGSRNQRTAYFPKETTVPTPGV